MSETVGEDDGKVTASQRHLSKAKSIIHRHYPQGGQPSGLLTDIYKAIRGAEMFGFSDCLRYFTPPDDDAAPPPNHMREQ